MAVIYLDAGHGGTAPGTSGTYNGKTYLEKDMNLKIILKVRDFLKTVKPLPAIYLWRTYDHNGELYARGQDAKAKNSDVFVSVHNNAYSDSSVTGTLVLYPKDFTEGHIVSKEFAGFMESTVVGYLNSRGWGVVNRGIDIWTNSPKPTDELGVFAGAAPIPSCLIEVAFMSSPSDMQKLTNPQFTDDAAYAIALGIVRWLNANKNSGLSDPLRTIPVPVEKATANIAKVLIPVVLIGGIAYLVYFLRKRS